MASKKDILDLYFMDARCKLLDIAAFLDRLDRAAGDDDFRSVAFRKALELVESQKEGSRAQSMLELLSDLSEEPLPSATIGFAHGAPSPSQRSY